MSAHQTRSIPRAPLPGVNLRPVYLSCGAETMYAVLHMPTGGAIGVAVVICPPFGWEEVSSHRSLHLWATRLAAAGHPTLHLTYPSTGDSSGGARDLGRLAAWTRAVACAARYLRSHSGRPVVALGLSFGGLIASHAAITEDGALDGLILWAAPAKGRELLRQFRAFSRFESSEAYRDLPTPPSRPTGELEAAGFLISADTAEELNQLDLTRASWTQSPPLGVLILQREAVKVTGEIALAWQAQGVAVQIEPGDGYAGLTAHPQQSQLPEAVAAEVERWLRGHPEAAVESARPAGPGTGDAASGDAASNELVLASGAVRERPVAFQVAERELFGILTRPTAEEEPVAVVFLNAGAIRHIGPNRMWVELARRWAMAGVLSLRLDVEGVGESDGEPAPYGDDGDLYVPELVTQVVSVLEQLKADGIAERFVLVGMCSGAYWAFHAAIESPLVQASMLLNLRMIRWDENLGTARSVRHASYRSLARLGHRDTRARVGAAMRWLVSSLRRRMSVRLLGTPPRQSLEAEVEAALDALRRSGKRTVFLFAANEDLDEELINSGREAEMLTWPHVSIERIEVNSHTLRPTAAQQRAIAILDRHLTQEILSSDRSYGAGTGLHAGVVQEDARRS